MHDSTTSAEEAPFLNDSATEEHIEWSHAQDFDHPEVRKLKISLLANVILMTICVTLAAMLWVIATMRNDEIAEPYCNHIPFTPSHGHLR